MRLRWRRVAPPTPPLFEPEWITDLSWSFCWSAILFLVMALVYRCWS